jgi:hypothetical protein
MDRQSGPYHSQNRNSGCSCCIIIRGVVVGPHCHSHRVLVVMVVTSSLLQSLHPHCHGCRSCSCCIVVATIVTSLWSHRCGRGCHIIIGGMVVGPCRHGHCILIIMVIIVVVIALSLPLSSCYCGHIIVVVVIVLLLEVWWWVLIITVIASSSSWSL